MEGEHEEATWATTDLINPLWPMLCLFRVIREEDACPCECSLFTFSPYFRSANTVHILSLSPFAMPVSSWFESS